MLVGAIAASIVLHLVIALSLAAFGSVSPPAPAEDDKPVELTIVDTAPTPPPTKRVNSPFIDTPDSKRAEKPPEDKTFESNQNSLGASALAANGSAPIPTTDGADRRALDLDPRAYSLPSEGSTAPKPTPPPQPSSTPAPTAPPNTPEPKKPEPSPRPEETPPPDQLAMLRPTPPPAFTPSEQTESSPTPQMRDSVPLPTERPTPDRPSSAYQRQQLPTKLSGNISNRGVSSVNAVGTPLGQYQKMLYDSVGKHWYVYVEKQRDLISIGTASLSFSVDRDGHVTNLKVISNSANEAFANVCLMSVQQVKMPPMPEDVAAALPPDGLAADINFTMAPNAGVGR